MVMLRDVMSRHYDCVHPDAPAPEAIRQLVSLNLTMLPVCDGRRVVGMLEEVREDVAGLKVRDVMSPDVLTGREDQDVREVITLMRARDIRTLPVLDAQEELAGVFTLGGPWKRGLKR